MSEKVPALTMVGSEDAEACVDDACLLPAADADPQVEQPTVIELRAR